MSRLEAKIAIVTGGTGGIGKGIALEFAAWGATVVINGWNAPKAESILAELRQAAAIAAEFLPDDESAYLTGATINPTGGLTVH